MQNQGPCWMGASILYSIEYKTKAPIHPAASILCSSEYKPKAGGLDSVFSLIQNQGPRSAWGPRFCVHLNTKSRLLSSMGASILYSLEPGCLLLPSGWLSTRRDACIAGRQSIKTPRPRRACPTIGMLVLLWDACLAGGMLV